MGYICNLLIGCSWLGCSLYYTLASSIFENYVFCIVTNLVPNNLKKLQSCMQNCKIHHSVVGLRSCISEGAIIEDTLLMGADYYEVPAKDLHLLFSSFKLRFDLSIFLFIFFFFLLVYKSRWVAVLRNIVLCLLRGYWGWMDLSDALILIVNLLLFYFRLLLTGGF